MLSFASLHTSAAALGGLPFIEAPELNLGIPIHVFGILVAGGVMIGAELLRRFAYRFGIEDDDIRSLTIWIIVTGFIGAHVLDLLIYEQDRLAKEGPILLLKLWDGISSYGGFVGGLLGYLFWVWWKRMTPGLIADVTIVGLLPAFSIGRIGCTLVHDHIGRATDSVFGVDYPRSEIAGRGLLEEFAEKTEIIRAHNLAMYELAYLVPVNLLVLWWAFRSTRPDKRLPAGFLAALTGFLYAPVRFFLEFWRLNTSDPRYFGWTFAQWASLAAFIAGAYALVWLWRRGIRAPLEADLGGRPGGRQATMAALAKAQAKDVVEGEGGPGKVRKQK